MDAISDLFHKHREMAGSPLITEGLHDDPRYKTVHRSRVVKIMQDMGLRYKT
jgi:putative transposase